jgi:competence protein ComEC
MNFLQRTPFFRLLLPLVTGIVVFRYFHLEPWLLVVLVFLSFAFVLNAYFIRSVDKQYHFRWLFGVGIGLFLFVLGYWLSVQRQQEAVFTDLNRKGIFRRRKVLSGNSLPRILARRK